MFPPPPGRSPPRPSPSQVVFVRTAMKVIEFLDARKDVCPPDLGREDEERLVLLQQQLATFTRQASFGYTRKSVRGWTRPFSPP